MIAVVVITDSPIDVSMSEYGGRDGVVLEGC